MSILASTSRIWSVLQGVGAVAPRSQALVRVVDQSPDVELPAEQLGRREHPREPELTQQMLGYADRSSRLAAEPECLLQANEDRLDRDARGVDGLGVRVEVPAAEESERCR